MQARSGECLIPMEGIGAPGVCYFDSKLAKAVPASHLPSASMRAFLPGNQKSNISCQYEHSQKPNARTGCFDGDSGGVK